MRDDNNSMSTLLSIVFPSLYNAQILYKLLILFLVSKESYYLLMKFKKIVSLLSN